MVLNVHRNHKDREKRGGGLGGGGWRGEKREGRSYTYHHLSLHCHRQNDICIQMGSDESHFMFH